MRYQKTRLALLLASALLIGALAVPRSAGAAATITVINFDGAGEGFNDPSAPDAASTAGGNAGATLGAQRLIAFQFAANLWGAIVDSNVEIEVAAFMDPLTCSAGGAVLGAAGPTVFGRDFAGAPVAGTWYPVALVRD